MKEMATKVETVQMAARKSDVDFVFVSINM